MIPKIIKFLPAALLCGLSIASCDFAEKNISPNNSPEIEPAHLLTYIEFNTTDGGICKNLQIGYCMMMVQQTASLEREAMGGDKYFQTEPLGAFFNTTYNTVIKNWRDMMIRCQKEEKYTNTLAVGKIWGAFLMHRITDLYGDVPYTEAGVGYTEQIFYPAYDRQEKIYEGMITEIQDGLALFDESKGAIKGDIIYNGDIAKWKKFGNSMLLRLGMRIAKAKPDRAKEIITKALNGGIINSADGICMVKHLAEEERTENPIGYRFRKDNFIKDGIVKISETFMDHLKSTNDPRLKVYASLPNGNANPAEQKGLPNGYDLASIKPIIENFDLSSYSNFNTKTILAGNAPTIFMSSAESQLLQAEAILKGWATGNAEEVYKSAVASSMREQAVYGNGGNITEDEISAYLSQDLFNKATTVNEKLELLGKEYWVATFINGYESYANWRRTGYPKIKPTNYTGAPNSGRIPRRFVYPVREYTINKVNVEKAIQQQGADNLNTRIWWDKE